MQRILFYSWFAVFELVREMLAIQRRPKFTPIIRTRPACATRTSCWRRKLRKIRSRLDYPSGSPHRSQTTLLHHVLHTIAPILCHIRDVKRQRSVWLKRLLVLTATLRPVPQPPLLPRSATLCYSATWLRAVCRERPDVCHKPVTLWRQRGEFLEKCYIGPTEREHPCEAWVGKKRRKTQISDQSLHLWNDRRQA